MKNKILENIKNQIPFPLKRSSSLISIALATIVTGFLLALGTWLFQLLVNIASPYAPSFINIILRILTYTVVIKINIFTIFLSVVLLIIVFFSTYRFFDKWLLKKGEVVFEDNFEFGNKGWRLNYWGSNDPEKTCRLEHSSIIFEAEEKDLADPRREFGAYYDLTMGIYEGSKYEVSCWAKSTPETSMGFKLWVHDTKDQNEMIFPARFYTPGTNFEEIKLGFVGTSSQALRIHLHNKAGVGRIIIDKVKVTKVK